MPSALASERPPARHDALDNYDVDFDDDDPFASPPPEITSKKRKEPDSGLGIDEEVSIKKNVRVPNVKLDDDRLLGLAGIPKLRKRAAGLKLKGKGHEFSDASRLLSFYQLWLDDLFPKARFLDALAMVEKAGHKKKLMTARTGWIDEGKPKTTAAEDDQDADPGNDAQNSVTAESLPSSNQDTSQTSSASQRPKTPPPPAERDVPDDDDLYDATPRAPRSTNAVLPRDDAPDEDDLEALIAEAEGDDSQRNNNGNKKKRSFDQESDGDDLDALMAEAEAQDGQGDVRQESKKAANSGGHDFADDEEAMQEMEGMW